MEEYISVNEYMRRFKIGHKNVLNLIATNQVEYQITETGRCICQVKNGPFYN